MWLVVPILLVLHVIVCLLLVLVVLMQLPRSEGLGAAFGGAVTENIFGAQTTHVLAKFTVWLGVAFFAITLALAIAYSHRGSGRTRVQQELLNTAAPAAPSQTAAPATTPGPAITPMPATTPAPVTPLSSPTSMAPSPTLGQTPTAEQIASPPPSAVASPAP